MLVEIENKPDLFISLLKEKEEPEHMLQDLPVKDAPKSKFLELYGTVPEIWNKGRAVALYGIKENSLFHYWTLKMVQKKTGISIQKWALVK
jgi:hypothetical protein